MIAHYIKISFRTLWKYKVQSLLSLIGLAVAFACVSLALYWSHYEENYDSFHRNADRIYQCWIKDDYSGASYKNGSPLGIPIYMEETYPEVEKACIISRCIEVDDNTYYMAVTPGASGIFDFECIEGNSDMETWNENQVGVSEEYARKHFGESSPIGRKITYPYYKELVGEVEIVAVYKTWTRHSNFRYDLLGVLKTEKWIIPSTHFYVLLNPQSNHKQAIEKLQKDTIRGISRENFKIKSMIPLKSLYYTEDASDINSDKKEANLQIKYVHLFSLAAVLLSFCALLNYLTLFISRLTTKGRDIALRTVCGSSGWQLSKLLMTEYLMLLLAALFLSLVFIEWGMKKFTEFAMIEVSRSTVYTGCFILLLFVIVLAMLLSAVPIFYFKKKTLRMQIEPAMMTNGKNPFRKASLCVQLLASMLFMLCATVMIKQVYFLTHADIGVERKNIAYIVLHIRADKQTVENTLKQLPFVKETVFITAQLYPFKPSGSFGVENWEEKPKETPSFIATGIHINDDVADFFDIRIKEGISSFDAMNNHELMVNEAFVKAMNVNNPIGKSIHFYRSSSKIVGVVHDIQAQNPMEPVIPATFIKRDDKSSVTLAFKYEGDYKSVKEKVKEAFKTKQLEAFIFDESAEEMFKGFLVSEYNFLKMLSIVTCVIILIALFGVYALILQECELQRKSIAVRKVFGAQVKDILMMFFREYMMQVVMAAALAFPVGYVLMKRWLEGYSRQTTIGIEVFLGIFLGMALLVLLCIGWHVWQAANENPATAVKKE